MKRFRKKPKSVEEKVSVSTVVLEGVELELLSKRKEFWEKLYELIELMTELENYGACLTKANNKVGIDFDDFGFEIIHSSVSRHTWYTVRIPENHHSHCLLQMCISSGTITKFEDHHNFLGQVYLLIPILSLLKTKIYDARIKREERQKAQEEAKTEQLKQVGKLLDQQGVK